jgi:clan AA aspartic protease (TIGR02281 family)
VWRVRIRLCAPLVALQASARRADPGTMRPRAASLLLVWLACLPGAARAEIYRWTDAQGRVHFTQDLSQVPPAQRATAAGAGREAGGGRLQTFESPARGAPASAAPPAGPASSPTATAYRVQVQRAGPSMLVMAVVNGVHRVPFLIDTGATDVLLPRSAAERIGLEVGPETRTKRYATANGMVEHPVVMLDSVDLGGAVAREVPASIGPELEFGLLGLSYFNRFTTHVDAAAGIVTLVPNGLAEAGVIRGGRSEAQWRSEYRNLHDRVARLEAELARTPESHGRERRRLEAEQAELAHQLSLLDSEADGVHVPEAWRE